MKTLYNQIPIGSKNAMPLCDLSAMWGLSPRETRRQIEQMINSNMPVVNLRAGYFRPETAEELKAYLKIIHSYKCRFEKKHYRLKTMLERFDNLSMGL